MRAQIYTADIVNLTEVSVIDDQENEQHVSKIQPNVEGELEISVGELSRLSRSLSEPTDSDCRLIVIVSPDAVQAFYAETLSTYFNPIERAADIEAGNIGSIIGMQVVRGVQSDVPVVAVAEVRDTLEAVEIVRFNASAVKL